MEKYTPQPEDFLNDKDFMSILDPRPTHAEIYNGISEQIHNPYPQTFEGWKSFLIDHIKSIRETQ